MKSFKKESPQKQREDSPVLDGSERQPRVLRGIERRSRAVALTCLGHTEAEIAGGLGVSESVIRRDLRSAQDQEYATELLRIQYKDIAEEKDVRIRLLYRDRLLDKLMPKKVRQAIEGGRKQITISMWNPDNEKE